MPSKDWKKEVNMDLANITKIQGNKGKKKRIGRGGGSGKGFHTVGRGNKGQKARRGRGIPIGFEGGQVPLYKKLPKIRGFKQSGSKPVIINIGDLNKLASGDTVDVAKLVHMGIVAKEARYLGVKVLSKGTLKKQLTFTGVGFSKSAKNKILKANGKI